MGHPPCLGREGRGRGPGRGWPAGVGIEVVGIGDEVTGRGRDRHSIVRPASDLADGRL